MAGQMAGCYTAVLGSTIMCDEAHVSARNMNASEAIATVCYSANADCGDYLKKLSM